MWVAFVALVSPSYAQVRDGDAVEIRLPSGDATATLPEFAKQTHAQLLFGSREVRGIRTNAIDGVFSPAFALEKMLAGTALESVTDSGLTTFSVRRRRAPASLTPANTPSRPTPAPEDGKPEEPLDMEAFQITSRRDAGLIAQSILRTDPDAPIYHQVINRREIESLGVTSIAELMTFVAGYSGEGMENLQTTVNLAFDGAGTTVYSGAFLKLRGFDSSRGAVLLNGRRLPDNVDSRGPDLSRIPLAAVARVDVLPFSGSALYGENVIGGAVNVVLRKDYVGRSLTTMYGTTTRGGASEFSVTATEGLTADQGKTRATIIADFQRRDALRLRDRPFLSRALAETSLEKIWRDSLQFSGRTLTSDERRYLITTSPSYPALILAPTALSDLVLPNAPGQWWTTVPLGQDGSALTPSSFSNRPQLSSLQHRNARAILRRPNESYSFTAQVEHAFIPELLELYSEMSYSRAEDRFSAAHLVNSVTLVPGQSGNPLSTMVVVYVDPVDLPDNAYDQVRSGARAVLGLRGKLGGSWRWTVDGSGDWTRTKTVIESPNIPFNALFASGFPGRFQIYNVLADHKAFPVSQELIEKYFRYRSDVRSSAVVFGANARVFGPLVALPAGDAIASVRAEYRDEVNRGERHIDFSRDLYQLIGQLASMEQQSSSQSAPSRFDVAAATLELKAPLVGRRWQPIPIQSAEINWSARLAQTSTGESRITQTAALKAQVRSWIAFRGAYSEGFSPPPYALSRASVTTTTSNVTLYDPLRGNLTVSNYTLVQGGRPGLKSETSRSYVAGILLNPARSGRISFSADAWQIEDRNAFRTPFPQEMLDQPALFPGAITRAAPFPGESVGRVTQIDNRAYNIASVQSSGLDLAGRWRFLETQRSRWEASVDATLTRKYTEQFGSDPAVDRTGAVGGRFRGNTADSPLLPVRGRATIAWQKGALRVAVSARHNSGYDVYTVAQQPRTAATAADTALSGHVAPSTLFDLQITYGPTARPRHSILRFFGRTTWSLGVRNLFDQMPAYRFDGVSFYNHFEDPRMRFVYLRVEQDW